MSKIEFEIPEELQAGQFYQYKDRVYSKPYSFIKGEYTIFTHQYKYEPSEVKNKYRCRSKNFKTITIKNDYKDYQTVIVYFTINNVKYAISNNTIKVPIDTEIEWEVVNVGNGETTTLGIEKVYFTDDEATVLETPVTVSKDCIIEVSNPILNECTVEVNNEYNAVQPIIIAHSEKLIVNNIHDTYNIPRNINAKVFMMSFSPNPGTMYCNGRAVEDRSFNIGDTPLLFDYYIETEPFVPPKKSSYHDGKDSNDEVDTEADAIYEEMAKEYGIEDTKTVEEGENNG